MPDPPWQRTGDIPDAETTIARWHLESAVHCTDLAVMRGSTQFLLVKGMITVGRDIPCS